MAAQPEHDDARCTRRVVAADVTEMEVECDEGSTLLDCDSEQCFILDARELLVSRERGAVAGSFQNLRDEVWNVLVEFE